ncbi:ABC-F type ribosomal protection protein [Rossellomorea aquimaris]|uniref:ribosomal protection-like ABC-F family protein n=1 Tax=Rossellomorea aquimaris TaxID=189382 RepID=UPI001CD2E836|nr:ABC-F type ribosomal protection protein [Rossellomorea aquimaris]MCA1055847.1 ABC-F type ribosomal protection protein [Rossellomorea aquimaris]
MREVMKLLNLRYEIGNQTLFEEVNGSVQEGDVIGIIGRNGSGKSTLLHMIYGDIEPVDGTIQWLQSGVSMELVVQETTSHSPGAMSPAERKLLEKWQVPTHEYSLLSGGEKLKARLARGFASNTDLLLLDEPTNHLDQASLEQLKEQINEYRGTVILISHDRYFLDEVAKKIWSLETGKLIEHSGNYSSYMEARKQKRLTQQREYEKQQKMVKRVEDQMRELTSWSQKAHAQSTKQEGYKEHYRVKAKRTDSQVKSKQKRLERELEKAKVEEVEEEQTVKFSLHASHKKGKRFLEVKDLAKGFEGRMLFSKGAFTIQHGEKVAVTGPNGSGKTTLLKVIMNVEDADGDVWVSPSAHIGYLTQEVFDLPLDESPHQLFDKETFEERGKVQTLMKHLGFMATQWNEPIRQMSMGERVKLKLMKYMLEERDVLILDEPTNHLDLPSREQLEETLSQYHGTLIIVSHDRYFLEKTTNVSLVIENGRIHKKLQDEAPVRNDQEELKLKLETERQEVLGRLSFMVPGNASYAELDRKFMELTKEINALTWDGGRDR